MRRLCPLLLILLAGCSTAPEPPAKVKVLFFTQANCPPCDFLKRQLADPAIVDAANGVEIEYVMHPDPRFVQHGITGTPCLVALTPDGPRFFAGGTLGQLRAFLTEFKEPEPLFEAAAAIEKITEGGPVAPDGKTAIVCDLPASERKRNIASQGLGCCVFRSIEYASRWQTVPELYDLPEQMVKANIPGGGYPDKVKTILAKFGPNVAWLQDTSGDPAILEAILASGRLPCVTYNGHDGVHYQSTIAHMVCLPFFSRALNLACVMDNNFIGENQFLWMSADEFIQRWKGQGGGWVVALLSTPPPPPPHN